MPLRNTIWSDANLIKFINLTKEKLTEASKRNFKRWPVLGKNVYFSNRKACIRNGIPIYCDTFKSAVDEHLKVWLLGCAQWIDNQFR
ncbi:MAG TPA: hypothetical protein EYH01_10810 [Campylobacterales bacterium]|nr:hypothetical protein [Campylobacterales bacterium]